MRLPLQDRAQRVITERASLSSSSRVGAGRSYDHAMAAQGYSAEDDPTWARLGITRPSTLANITLNAKRDRRVAATIAAGLYDNVIVFFDRLSSRHAQNLPPSNLAGPLLVDGYRDDPEVPNAVEATYATAALERLRARR